MANVKKISDKEILQDMSAMLKHTVDFERTLGTLNVNEDEELIFKRAAHQLRKENPNMLILRKSYDIFIAKSFSNTANTAYDTQAILSEKGTKTKHEQTQSDTKNLKIIAVIILLITIYKLTSA